MLEGLGICGVLGFFFMVLWWCSGHLGCFGGRLFIGIILGFGFFVFILVLLKGRSFIYTSAKKFQDLLQYSNKTDLYY